MLSRWDDYPIHQAALPVAQPVSDDVGRYDRHWLAMHDVDLTTQVGFGLSVHPNRGLVDAAFSVARGGRQASVFGSATLTRDRDMVAGPLRLEVVEPMRALRVVVEQHDGISADLTFTATTQHVEDGRMRRESAGVLLSERIRSVQFGDWHGSFTVDGETVDCAGGQWPGFRDRSWGTRTTGTVAEAALPAHARSIWFAWTLLRFPDECLLVAQNQTPQGRSEARTVAVLPYLADGEPAYGEEEKVLRGDDFRFDIDYSPGTRRPRGVHLRVGPGGGVDRDVRIEPVGLFQMQGLGYYHPTWRHGTDHGGERAGSQRWLLADLDPTVTENLHVQQLCRATRSDGSTGIGLFEHVAIGPHLPSGLPDGIAPRA